MTVQGKVNVKKEEEFILDLWKKRLTPTSFSTVKLNLLCLNA